MTQAKMHEKSRAEWSQLIEEAQGSPPFHKGEVQGKRGF